MNKLPFLFVLSAPLLGACSATDTGTVDEHDPGASAAWERAYEEVEMGKADGSGCSGVAVPDTNGFQKRVALTFDDGPNPETTPQILDILARHGIRATFFINGSKVSSPAAWDLLARIRAEGHILANHSQTHMDFQDMSSAAQMDEAVRLTHEIVQSAGETPEYFRFPYGSATCGAINIVEGYGLRVTGWHVDSADWCFRVNDGYCSPGDFRHVPSSFRHDFIGYTMSQIRAHNGGIVLFHDIHQFTANNVETIIGNLENEGFSFTNIDDTATFPRLNGITPPFIGDVCGGNEDCAFEGGRCQLFPIAGNKQGGFCTTSCQGTCPDATGEAPTFCTSLDNGVSGSCVSKAHMRNQDCAAIPGTMKQSANRFIGTSHAAPATADVCLPQ